MIRAAVERAGFGIVCSEDAERLARSEIDAGEALLSHASDLGADLIVMGAYGHGRLREFVLGGATRTILQAMTVPVLVSH